MAGTKVFISSTCYDLSILRAELRNFVLSLGHEPVMSEYADVLYDPRIHTHTSCVNEVSNCDMMVVIIGSRFGGTSVPQALDQVDLSRLQDASKDPSFITDGKPISITQLEVLKAIENNIPIYTFVEKKLYYEHEIYEKNKDKPAVIKDLVFPAIDKPFLWRAPPLEMRRERREFFPYETGKGSLTSSSEAETGLPGLQRRHADPVRLHRLPQQGLQPAGSRRRVGRRRYAHHQDDEHGAPSRCR